MAEALEERTLLTALVIDSNTFGSTPGVNINITNASLDANSDGISDYDNLVIASSDLPITVGPAGVGIRINLSNLTGLRNITIDNLTINAGAGLQGIDIDINNILLESLTVDQVAVTTTNANGIDINLQNIGTVAGADVTVKDSTVRSTGVVAVNTPATGVQVTLGSTTRNTHLNSLTVADSTVQGISVVSTAGATFQTLVDQSAAKNNRVQDVNGVASPITYNFTRTTVGDLRVDDNLRFRNLAITATNSPLGTVGGVTIDNNTGIDLSAITATTTGISLTATSTNAAGTLRSDITGLHIGGNTINGAQANANVANGIALTLTDSNLGSYTNDSRGATIIGNTITNLSDSVAAPGTAVAMQITATASATFVAGNDVVGVGNNLPLLLDLFNGDNATGVRSTASGDLNGITGNVTGANDGRQLVVTTVANTIFLGDVTGNTFRGENAGNRREGVVMSFTDRPTAAGFDSFNLLFDNNTVDGNRRGGVDISMLNTAVGAMTITNNVITNTEDALANTPDGILITLDGTSVTQQATNLLRKSFISNNSIGQTLAGGVAANGGNGVSIVAREMSEIQDLQIRNNAIANSGESAISVLREDEARFTTVNPEADQTRAVTIADNQTQGNTFHGLVIDARNGSTDILDFEVRDNFIGNNLQTGLHLIARADARLLVDITNNQIVDNASDGIELETFQNATSDKRQIGGTWTKNTISRNGRNGINVFGRHGLYDEATGIRTPLQIGLEGIDPADGLSRGNVFQANNLIGMLVNLTFGTSNGDIGFTNNLVTENRSGGVRILSNEENVAIKNNRILANQGIGLNLVSTGGSAYNATVRDNLITGQVNIAGGNNGDGVEITSLGFQTTSVLMLNNFIDSNAGRGIDVLNAGGSNNTGPTLQLQIGDGTVAGMNTVVSNALEGIYVVNSSDGAQSQNVAAFVAMQAAGDVFARPDMMLNVDGNIISSNGGSSGFNGTGLILRVGTSGSDGSTAATPGFVGSNSGDPNAGNGRVNSRVTNNFFEGNFGNDFYVDPFLSTGPGASGGTWDTNGANVAGLQRDPLSRLNMVFDGNVGNGINVQNFAFFSNNEPQWKSRSSNSAVANPPGPFGNTARLRSVTNLRGAPILIGPGLFSFAFEALGASTWRVEAGFDRSGGDSSFPFYNSNAGGGGSQNNFDDTGLWAQVAQGTFSFPNVDSPTFLTAEVSIPTDPQSVSGVAINPATITFSEFVTNVDISDFRLLRNGVVVPLESAPGVPLTVSPVPASQDPNNPLAFSSFTIDLSVPTATAGNYQLQVLGVDPSNGTFTPIEDVITQLNGQGNFLTRIIDGSGVLQDFAVDRHFTVDNVRSIATISPITPDPRNSAAGIVTVTFDEPVSGVDITDFVLLRDGQPVDLSAVTVTQITPSQYELNLNQLTGAAGNYQLRLVTVDEPLTLNVTEAVTSVIDVAGNIVTDNFAIGIAAADSWVVDTTLPFVSTVVTTPATTPNNTQVSAVLINFSEAVSGVTIGDLSLTRTDASGNTTTLNIGAIPLFQNTVSQYELNLSTVSGVAGTYRLTVNPVNSGIFDTANNAFETTFTATWVLDLSAPTADVVDVAPDPRQAPVDALNTIFSEPVSGLTIGQYVLAFDDGTPANGNVITGALNAPTITVTSPNHGLTNGTQITIYGVSGNTNTNGVFTVQNVTTNTFQLFDFATGLVPVPGNAVYVSGGRWARNMIGLGASTLTQESSLRHVVDLQTVTNNPGIYVVSLLSNAGAVDASGNALQSESNKFNVAAQDIWTYGPDVPPMGTITPIASPIGTNAGVVVVNFSEPLQKVLGTYPIDVNDFRLRRDTGSGFVVVSLTGATITQLSATSFSIDLTGAGITDVNGNYELSLINTDAVSPIRDLAGNLMFDAFSPGSGIASQVTWTKVFSDPSVTSIKGVFTDPLFDTDPVAATKLRAVQNLTINFSTAVTGINLADASKNFRLTRQSLTGTDTPLPVSLDGVTVTRITATQYRINLSTLTGTDGRYAFTVLANGLIQNSGFQPLLNARTISWSKDATIRPNQFSDSVDAIGTAGQVLGNEVVDSSASAGFQISLRAAIQEANALAGDDVIELGVGTYVLTLGGVQEDNAVSGDLDIRGLDSLIIRGKGIGQTIIDASGLPAATRDRLFQVMAGASLTLQGVTLQGGSVLGSEDGGAIRNTGTLTILDSEIRNNASQDTGGAIINTGTMTINRTTISGNTATATGGAILNTATMTILNSTLNNNTATSNGGAIANIAGATATLEGVTVAANRSTSGAGGGIRNDGTLRLINDTIAFNQSLQAGAGVSRNAGTVAVGNTIISDNFLLAAGNAQSDVAGTFTSSGNNIVRTVGAAVGFTGPGDQVGVNPNLVGTSVSTTPNILAVANFGGPTLTYGLQLGSAAIDRGNNNLRSADTFDLDNDGDFIERTPVDQRGAPRFLDGPTAVFNAVDVGAVEFGTFFVNTTTDSIDVNLGDGLAADGLGNTSLRAAIMEANALAGENAIILGGQTYQLNRTTVDATRPTITSITGVPTAPTTTTVGLVTITFSEAVGNVDVSDFSLTRSGLAVAIPATLFTRVSSTQYRIDLTTLTATNGIYDFGVNLAGTGITDVEGNALSNGLVDRVNWVRGTDTFAPTVIINPVTTVFPNAGTVTAVFSERVNNLSIANFSLTRNGVAVSLAAVPITITQDNNFGGRTVASLNLATVTALDGAYVLTLTSTVGANTIRDTATVPNNLAAGGSINWTKVPVAQIVPVTPDPRAGAVTTVTLQFSENVAGVQLSDFTMSYDDNTGIGPQTVSLASATLTPVSPVASAFGQAAQRWTLTFANNESARDGNYVLDFSGAALRTTAGAAFGASVASDSWLIGQNAGTVADSIGDLDLVANSGRVQIIGVGADATTSSLGLTVNPTIIDGVSSDRIFDVRQNAVVAISGVEMRNGRVTLERSGGAIRNLGTLTISDSDILTSFADGNGGGIANGDDLLDINGTLTLNRTNVQGNSAGSVTSGSQFGKGGAIHNDRGTVTIADGTYTSNAATLDGGAIYNNNSATVSITSATFGGSSAALGNTSGRDGGAIYNNAQASLVVGSTTFSSNRADSNSDGDGEGGAIYMENSSTLQLNNSILQGNSARSGGALYSDDATLTLTNNTFSLNSAINGGGAIFNSVGGILTLNNGLFTTNSANTSGGAIQNYGSLTISGIEFLNNSTGTASVPGQGGAIYNEDGTLSISNVEFNQNRSTGDAGAIYNQGNSTLTLSQTTFDLNTANVRGGAIFNNDFSSLTIDQTTFSSNSATTDGGALYNNSEFTNGVDRSATITASTFNNNTAQNGAAIFNSSNAGLTMTSSTLSSNIASVSGGGLANFGTADLLNNTIYLNQAPTGAGIANNLGGTPPFGPATLKNTIVAGGTTADIAGENFVDGGNNLVQNVGLVTTFVNGSNFNIVGVTPQLDVLRDNGGATQTHALLFGSAARDSGNNVGTSTSDQRGFTRIFDGDGNGVATVDIGAFESGFIINSYNDTIDENINDGINADRNGVSTLRTTIMQSNARSGEDTIILSPGTYTLTLVGRDEDGSLTGDLDITDDLNIIGAGTNQTFIDANQIDRLFQVFSGRTLNLSNLTLINGNASTTDNGGNIQNQGNLILTNVMVVNGKSARGGGVYNDVGATMTATDSVFAGNTAILQGGALYNDGTLTLIRAQVGQDGAGNFSNTHGGGLYNFGTLTITDSSFTDNTADSRGGAVYNAAVTTTLAGAVPVAAAGANTNITLTNVANFPTTTGFVIQIGSEQMQVTGIVGNVFTVTRGFAGTTPAAFAVGTSVTSVGVNTASVSGSTFNNNFASSRGAAIFNEDSFNITNSTLTTNASGTNAGIGNTLTGRVTVTNSTIVDNEAYRGGGLANSTAGVVTVKNTIVARNTSTTTSGITAPNVRGTFVTNGNNFIGNNINSTGFANTVSNDQVGSSTSPFDPVIAALADNGGETLTNRPRTGSPVINAGDNTGGDTTDQRGAPRPTNDDSDIGAIELQDIRATISDVTQLEGNGGSTLFRFTVTLSQASVEEIRVSYSLQGDSAFAGEDFINVSGTVVFAPNTLIQTITVEVNGDTSIEPTEQFFVNLTNPINVTLDDAQAVGTILTDDTGIQITDANKVETDSGDTTYTFTVSIVGAAITATQSVDYTSLAGTATAGVDFDLIPNGTLTFTPGGPSSQTINVTVYSDQTPETNETFFIQLSNNTLPLVFGKTTGVGTIFNDDLQFSVTGSTALEADPPFTTPLDFTVNLVHKVYVTGPGGAPTQATLTALVSTSSGTATSGQDFTPISNQVVTFTGTTTSQTVTATVLGDLRFEQPDETFVLQAVSGTINGVADSMVTTFSTAGTGTIDDNDPPPDTWRIYIDNMTGNIRVDLGVTGFLQSGIGMGAGSLTLVSASHFPTTTPFNIQIGAETLTVTNVSGNTFTLMAPGTTAAYAAGTPVTMSSTIVNTNDHTTAIVVNGDNVSAANPGAKDDLFLVDFSFGNPIPTNGLTVNGLGQVGADALQLVDNTNFFTFNTVTYNSTAFDSGNVVYGILGTPFTVNYTGLEPISDDTNANNRVFNAPVVGNDNVVLSSSNGHTSISSVLGVSLPSFESVTAKNPNLSLVVNGNNGTNTFQVTGGDVTFVSTLTINGLNGNDTIDASGWSLPLTINGGLGGDTISGGSAADTIDGGDGADSISGNGGADSIIGGLGNDTISGGDGADFVDGGLNDDSILGDAGDDLLSGNDGNDFINGGAGLDTVDGAEGSDTVNGGADSDLVSGGNGNDSVGGGTGDDSVNGGFGDDTLSADTGLDTLDGTDGSDNVKTSADVNQTLTNNQVAFAGIPTDTITLIAIEHAWLSGGVSNNTLDATQFTLGGVTLMGGLGSDTLLGTAFDDVLSAGITTDGTGLDLMLDSLNITDGSDSLVGGDGRDTLNGNGGNDTIVAGLGDDCVIGGAGNDSVDGGDGNDNVQGNGGADILLGGIGIDTLDGGENTDTLRGGDDGDSILGGAANDTIDGGLGDDTIDAGDGNDTVFGNDGNDSVGGGAGDDTLVGGLGDDVVNGNDGLDTLDGSVGFDTLFGGSGDDTLISTDGNDTINGQGGVDSFTYDADSVQDDIFTITAVGYPMGPTTGIGLARLNLSVFTTNLIGVENFTLNLGGGNDRVTLGDMNGVVDLTKLNINGGAGDDTIDGSLSVNASLALNAIMGDGNDSVIGTPANDTILGEAGNDFIVGGSGADSINGGDGNDNISSGSGNDTILGGNGNDTIDAGANDDTITGDAGNDSILAGDGIDTIDGGINDDFLDGGIGNDSIRGGVGNDRIAGRAGADTIDGGDGADTIKGGSENDSILGGAGNDLVDGELGNDTINGQGDNDFLLGGDGNDSILGGAGNDTCVGGVGNDTVLGQGGTDKVLGGSGTGTNTKAAGDRIGTDSVIVANYITDELFKILTARPNLLNELNF